VARDRTDDSFILVANQNTRILIGGPVYPRRENKYSPPKNVEKPIRLFPRTRHPHWRGVYNLTLFLFEGACVNKEVLFATGEWVTEVIVYKGHGVITVDEMGTVQYVNAEAEKLTGWRESEAKGKPWQEVFSLLRSKPQSRMNKMFKLVAGGRVTVKVEEGNCLYLVPRVGEIIPIQCRIAPARTTDDDCHGILLDFQNVALIKDEREFESVSAQPRYLQ